MFFAMLTDYITDKSCARRLQGAWSSRLWRPARSAAVPRRGRCEAPGVKDMFFICFEKTYKKHSKPVSRVLWRKESAVCH